MLEALLALGAFITGCVYGSTFVRWRAARSDGPGVTE
jgi:hypothetical protein